MKSLRQHKKMKLRTATKKDTKIICNIASRTFFETYCSSVNKKDLLKHIETSFNAKNILVELENNNVIYILAIFDGKPVGYAKFLIGSKTQGINTENSLEIERIYVMKEMVRKKIGTALMEKCLQVAKNHNCNILWLGVWEDNKPAILFYKKLGFKIFGSSIFSLGRIKHNDLLMKKIVNNKIKIQKLEKVIREDIKWGLYGK